MRRMWNEVKEHWLSATLFLIYWLIVFGLDVFRWQKPQNRPEDMVRTVIYLHFLLPVIVGALVSWWRRYTPGRIAGGMVAGAAVLVVDAGALLTHQLIAFHLGETGSSSERISELPVFLIAIGLVGSLLGLIGAAGATGLSHLLDRWHQRAATPLSPFSDRRVAGDGGAAVKTHLGGAGGIIPRRLLLVAGGLVLGAAVIVLFGVIPALASDAIARTAPRALPAFAVTAILNVLIGIVLLAAVFRRSGGAGKGLVVMAGFVSLLLGFALLDAASALTARGPARLLAAVACLIGAGCDLGAGVLALVAALRRHDLKPVHAPCLRGTTLRLVAALLERPAIRSLIAPWLTASLGLRELRTAKIDEPPTFFPMYGDAEGTTRPSGPEKGPTELQPGPGFRFHGIRDYHTAYLEGATTPEQVAERAMAAIASSDRLPDPIRAFIACQSDDVMSQAHQAARRWKAGKSLGPLDGVPIAIKDEIDMVPYPTTAGTRFLGCGAAQTDSTVVARLRSAGALLLGKANMHEIGILPNGLNPHHGPVRNPYSPAHEAGGSSSGSAAAVAAGLCAAAIGADGGGSIRIPAAYCGLVGLKPTFGRVSEFGAVPLARSVAHLGPIAATAEDAALVYAAIAGPDPMDPNTQLQPSVQTGRFDGSLKGVRIGIYQDWFSDAAGDVVAACEQLLKQFVRLGAELVEVVIPDLRLIALAHGLTIHTEMAANMEQYDREHRRDFSLTTRLMLANVRAMLSGDYVQAQRIRTRAMDAFRSALTHSDVIATPTTPLTAPEISTHALLDTESNIGQVVETMRFVNPANLTGLPAISIPSGYDRRGLPVGLQLIGRPWDERALFRLASAADAVVPRQRPLVYFDLLPEITGRR